MYKFMFLVCFVSLTVVAYDFKDSEYSKFYSNKSIINYCQNKIKYKREML